MKKAIIRFIEDSGLFSPSQHGFRAGRSCLGQLITHFDRITWLLEKGKNVNGIYLDFAKAFDTVDIGVILVKLKSLGISGRLVQWIREFLTNRTQVVLVHGVKSIPQPVLSGVPQGSVLGPLLFLVLIGDIDKEVN